MPTTTATELAQLGSVVTVNSGNVGIGTTTPDDKLDVNGFAILGTDIGTGQTSTKFHKFKGTAVQSTASWFGSYGGLLLDAEESLTAGARKFLITNSLTGNKFAIIRSTNATTDPSLGNSGAITSGTADFVITNTGDIGIGTASPISSLHIKQATPTSKITLEDFSTNRVGQIGGGSDGSGGILSFSIGNNGGSISEAMRIDSSGNVRIGTTSYLGGGLQALSVKQNADAWCMATQVTTNGNYGLVAVNASNTIVGGMIINASSTSFPTSSDYRLKTNLEAIANGIERIKQLPVYSFNWKIDESGNKVDGFIAHEARSVVPESVVGEKDAVDADGNPIYQGIDQSKIVPLLTAALKEAIAKIETLEAKVTALEVA